jgi:hypothetical protein
MKMEQLVKYEFTGGIDLLIKNPGPVLLFPPQIQRNLTWVEILATAVGIRRN